MDIHVLRDRMDLLAPVSALGRVWPEFMLWDPHGDLYYGDLEPWADHVIVGVLDGEVVARGMTIPFPLDGEEDLPDTGWDEVVLRGHLGRLRGATGNAISALEIAILPERRGSGLADQMVAGMRALAGRHGFDTLYAPVRPTRKADVPHTPMAEYAFQTREDGLPVDPWMRVHARAGARIVKVAPASMVIRGTLADWRGWTGLPFDTSGDTLVPGALVPVHVDVDHDHAVYIEPNVWMAHTTTNA